MNEIEIKGIDEKIYYDKALYDMPVYIWPNKNLNGFYLSLCVKYGSLDTDFTYKKNTYHVPNGIAHFMEHIKFNEDDKTTAHDFYNALGSDINAFTTFEYTNYEVYAHDNFKENLSHLISYVLNPYFTKKIIDKERGIITEEIKMDSDDPYSNLFYRSLGNVFKKSHYKNRVAGEVKDIKNIKLDDIKLIYEAFYHPQNMFAVITGNVNPYESVQIINDTLKEIKINNYYKPDVIKPKEPLKVYVSEDVYHDNVITPKGKINIKIPLKSFKGLSNKEILMYSNIIFNCNFGNTSDFKEELLEHNMITSFYFSSSILDNYLVMTITFESNVYEAVKEKVLSKLNNLTIDKNYLDRIIKCDIATMVLNYEDMNSVSDKIQNDIIFHGGVIDNLKELYESIDIDKINKYLKIYNSNNINITIVLPK